MARKLSLPDVPRRLAKPDSLSERIYGDLRARLQRCEIGPGDRLVDTDIAAAYGTSRMPVREALLRLANEGYLTGTTRGFVLPRLSGQDFREIFEVRRLLEPRAAALAARDLDEAGQRELARALEDARAALAEDDPSRLIVASARFRAAWLGSVRNGRLAETIARFVDHVQSVRLGTLSDAATREIVVTGLVELHEAFARRDEAGVEARMTAFIDAAEAAFTRMHREETLAVATPAPAGSQRPAGDAARPPSETASRRRRTAVPAPPGAERATHGQTR